MSLRTAKLRLEDALAYDESTKSLLKNGLILDGVTDNFVDFFEAWWMVRRE